MDYFSIIIWDTFRLLYTVFHNRDSHYGDSAFNPAKCDLVLNADKKQGGNATPKVFSDNEWLMMPNGQLMRWNSITFAQQ